MKKLVISSCKDCPMFDNYYYTYKHTCISLAQKIEPDENGDYPIPDNCPLDDEPTDEIT